MSYSFEDIDHQVRLAAFRWFDEQAIIYQDVFPRSILSQGFDFHGERVRLIGPQGIFKPRILPEIPLTITTSPNSPYTDTFGSDSLLHYRYRGENPNHRDNVGLRNAMKLQKPLIYLHGFLPGKYLAQWPAFIVGDDPLRLTFRVAIDEQRLVAGESFTQSGSEILLDENALARRKYLTTLVRQRLHQRDFRERVLRAYREQCALCKLRHRELLDAAHIVPDNEPEGTPIVRNGIALCKLHHAAFDSNFLGINPDYLIFVKPSILEEEDGPMLLHGLKELHRIRIHEPFRAADKPDRGLLEQRFSKFLAAS